MSISPFSALSSLVSRTLELAKEGLATRATRDASTLLRTEKHIRDVSRSEGHLSKAEHLKLRDRHQDNSAYLKEQSPKMAAQYLGTLAVMSYGQQARFVNSMNQLGEDIQAIESAVEGADDFESALVEMFSKPSPERIA